MLIAGREYNFIGTIQSGMPVDLNGKAGIIGIVSSDGGTYPVGMPLKKVDFTEQVNFQFRFEAFNVFNSPLRSGPVDDPSRADFGTIPIGQSNIPRQVQLGFKFNF